MKSTALTLVCAFALSTAKSGDVYPNGCPKNWSVEQLFPHNNCHKFYQCWDGKLVVHSCPSKLFFSIEQNRCEWAEEVDCTGREVPDDKDDESNENGGGTCNCNPDVAPGDCNCDNCNCANGNEGGTCNCNPEQPPGNCNCNNCNCDNSNGGGTCNCNPEQPPGNCNCGNDNGSGDNGDNGDDDNGSGGGTCNCNPEEAPAICAADDSDGEFIAHENCNQFYICSSGKPVALRCPGNLLFNPYTNQCDWADNVDCGDRVIPDGDCDGNENGGNGDGDNGDNGNGDNDDEDNGNGDSENGGGTCNCNPEEAPAICAADDSDGEFIAHVNCNQFYICSGGKPVALSCPGSLLFNPHTNQCDWADNVDCGDRVIPDGDCDDNGNGGNGDGDNGSGGGTCNCNPDNCNCDNDNGGGTCNCNPEQPPGNCNCNNDNGSGDNGGNGNEDNDDGDNDNGGGTCNCNPEEAPAICAADDSDGVLIAHANCNQFYICSGGKPVALRCPGSLLFNSYTNQCDWADNVDCGDRVIPDGDCDDNGNGGNGDGDNGDSGNGDNGDGDNGNDGGSCNCNPEEAPAICAADDSDGEFIAHENCNQFYICSAGKPVALRCPGSLLFNPYTNQCDWADNVDCGDRVIPGGDCDDNGNGGNGDGDNGSGGGTCNCNPDNCNCDNDNGGGTCNCNPEQPPGNCNCDNDNGSGDNGGNGNEDNGDGGNDNGGGTCNCNPEEAPAICSADDSDGVLIAHANCNQFYICSGGKHVALRCPGSLLFNPYTNQCDWADNVDCGDRVIPDGDCDDNGNGGNGDGDNGDSGNGDNGDEDNGNDGGSCNCNPEEAPAICAADDSDGEFIAHENCNQFYICSAGKPVALRCPGSLLFNPYTNQCDWADNVDCGDRVIPGGDCDDNGNGGNGDGDNGSGGGGTCNCNPDNCNCDNDNGGGTCNCNPEQPPGNCNCDNDNGSGDSGGNGNEDNGDGDNDNGGGTCNCNPEEAPAICFADDSDGVFIAHANCNQFYICSGGKPVALRCPGSLLFNPYTNQCDWADNVDCGDRVIPDGDCDDNGNGGNGDGDNGDSGNGDNGDGDNGNDGGSCNCNPEEAPAICAADDSDGEFIAHENCNQFYICSAGKPVALRCPGSLLFNPYTNQCDWTDNVDCGDRVIPGGDCDDNGNGGNGDGDNGSGGGTCNCNPDNCNCDNDNGGGTCNCNPEQPPGNCNCDNDNGSGDSGGNGNEDNGDGDNGNGGGTCNCNPEEAPAICSADDSDGVLIAHANCNQFYICSGGKPVALRCPGSLLFNPYTNQCDWADNVDCGDRVIPDGDCDDNGNGGNGDGDNGDSGNGDNGDGDNGNDGGSCNCNPEEAPAICAADDSDGEFIAHENCNQFYICSAGKPVALRCPGSLLFNPYTNQCDWTDNVDCGDRVIPGGDCDDNGNGGNGDGDNGSGGGTCNCNPDNCNCDNDNGGGTCNCNPEQPPGNCNCDNDSGSGDSGGNGNEDNGDGDNDNGGGTCNCNPEEAPAICAADDSDGVLIAHEDCNQFYICNGGRPDVLSCPENLLFNPFKDQCDWPENVDCGDRIIPDDECDDNDNGNDNTDADEENDNNELSCIESIGGAGNDDPRLASAICSSENSDGVLVAHENCNQFYICDNSTPVAVTCPATLMFNPYNDKCDWSHCVKCNNRVYARKTAFYTSLNKHSSARQVIRFP